MIYLTTYLTSDTSDNDITTPFLIRLHDVILILKHFLRVDKQRERFRDLSRNLCSVGVHATSALDKNSPDIFKLFWRGSWQHLMKVIPATL